MCMKDRLFRMRRQLTGAFALLLIGGLMYSCSDDYDLPDKTPGWLGSSIYAYLKDKGNYTNTVKLIEDLDYTEVLAKTGSKTLFVADDDAYTRFFANNPWGVRSYEELTQSQKRLLLNSSMFDNAYLLEMMPNLSSSSMGSDGTYLDRNRCLRQPTSVAVSDYIGFVKWDSLYNGQTVLPKTENLGRNNAGGRADKDYWSRFREQSKGGIYMVSDGTAPLMVHWIAGQLGEQKITNDDFAKIVGKERQPNDAYVFGSKVIEQDITCQNGYIDVLDNVFITPENMAEMIRANGRTQLFSHMLDRFSAPYYNGSLTRQYQQLNPAVDSVFEKRYLSARSQGGSALERDPNNNRVSYYLTYDPGWTTYYNASHGVQVDMGAMFVPSDDAIRKYFLNGGGGQFLMDAYATEKPVTAENLMFNLDQVPLEVIQALINNLMKASFIETVPSKYLTIMNDARDPMFSNAATVEEYKAKIDTCLIANNGVVYVMNEVYTPAKYASVSAPALVGDSLRIFNWAITADDKYITNPNSAPLNSFISTYLLAMSTNFSFFVPTDNALQTYYDPVYMSHTQPYVLAFRFDPRSTSTPVTARAKKYDPLTGEIDSVYASVTISSSIVNNRLKDMLDAHIIVDSSAAKLGVYDGNEYYISKGGAPVKVARPNDGVNGMTVYGGWQLDHPGQECHVKELFDKSEKTNGYGNGMTYVIDRPIQSTVKSVYSIMNDNENEDSPYREFFDLCNVDPEVIDNSGFLDEYTNIKEKDNARNRYMVFVSGKCMDQNVRFFNTYRYTVYIPKNECVRDAINNGLPTWAKISEYIAGKQEVLKAHETDWSDEEVAAFTDDYKQKAQAMVTCLLNFVKYHFQDNSVFVDNNPIETTAYETACINNVTNRYITLEVSSANGQSLDVKDKDGNTRHVITEEGQDRNYNMLTRDMEFDAAKDNSKTISTSSYAVLHRIDGVLNFMELNGGRYDAEWQDAAEAKKFVAKYRIRK